MTYRHYLLSAIGLAVVNGLALAIVLALAMFLIGDTSADVNADLGFERFDGLWLLILLPSLLVVLLLILSPLAYFIRHLLIRLVVAISR